MPLPAHRRPTPIAADKMWRSVCDKEQARCTIAALEHLKMGREGIKRNVSHEAFPHRKIGSVDIQRLLQPGATPRPLTSNSLPSLLTSSSTISFPGLDGRWSGVEGYKAPHAFSTEEMTRKNRSSRLPGMPPTGFTTEKKQQTAEEIVDTKWPGQTFDVFATGQMRPTLMKAVKEVEAQNYRWWAGSWRKDTRLTPR